MPRLIWVFAGGTCHLLVLSQCGSYIPGNLKQDSTEQGIRVYDMQEIKLRTTLPSSKSFSASNYTNSHTFLSAHYRMMKSSFQSLYEQVWVQVQLIWIGYKFTSNYMNNRYVFFGLDIIWIGGRVWGGGSTSQPHTPVYSPFLSALKMMEFLRWYCDQVKGSKNTALEKKSLLILSN